MVGKASQFQDKVEAACIKTARGSLCKDTDGLAWLRGFPMLTRSQMVCNNSGGSFAAWLDMLRLWSREEGRCMWRRKKLVGAMNATAQCAVAPLARVSHLHVPIFCTEYMSDHSHHPRVFFATWRGRRRSPLLRPSRGLCIQRWRRSKETQNMEKTPC